MELDITDLFDSADVETTIYEMIVFLIKAGSYAV